MKRKNRKNLITRSSKLTLKFANDGKRNLIEAFLNEYRIVTQEIVNILFDQPKVQTTPDKTTTDQVETYFNARLLQCCAKQASGIVRGVRRKQEKRLWKIRDLERLGKKKDARRLQKIYNDTIVSLPHLGDIEAELDQRFVKIVEGKNSFDLWLVLSLGNKTKVNVPLRRTKHFNKFTKDGFSATKGVRLSKNGVTVTFEKKVVPTGDKETIGIDVGIKRLFTASNGSLSKKDNHGHDLGSIIDRLARRKKDSKGFKRAVAHRNNYIGWSVNRLNLDKVGTVVIEDLKNVRKGKRTSRKLTHFTYGNIFGRLVNRCEREGVLLKRVDPSYTSQTCSRCGVVSPKNRKGVKFKCIVCNHTSDADENASVNIRNRFLWRNISDRADVGAEPIVPHDQKAISYIS